MSTRSARPITPPSAQPWAAVSLPETVFCWQARHSRELWISIGIAAAFESLEEAQAALPAADGLPFAPRCAAVVAFDPGHPTDLLWQDFPRARYWLPRVQLRCSSNDVAGIEFPDSSGKAMRYEWTEPSEEAESLRTATETSNLSQAEWTKAVQEIKRQIEADEISKAVLSRRVVYELEQACDLRIAAKNILHSEDSTYKFALRGPDSDKLFCGLSPERLFYLYNNRLLVDSLAGSRSRGSTPEEAARNKSDLLKSHKDQLEQRYVTDYIREQLLSVSESVSTTQPAIRETANVMHLFTEIGAELSAGVTAEKILHTLHPTPAVCGLPTNKARDLIARLEPDDRGLYAGAIGMATTDEAEFAVAIRSGVIEPDRLTLFAGAGIVAGSDANAEFAECEWKLQSMKSALLSDA